MKKINLLLIIILFISVTFSCSKNENCSFDASTFIGKWKFSKVVENGIDKTSDFFLNEPCQKTSIIEFKSSGIMSNSNPVSNCRSAGDRNWAIKTISNKNLLIMNDIGQKDYDTVEISSINCTDIVINNGYELLTITKQ